jgi:hypothetical protein
VSEEKELKNLSEDPSTKLNLMRVGLQALIALQLDICSF